MVEGGADRAVTAAVECDRAFAGNQSVTGLYFDDALTVAVANAGLFVVGLPAFVTPLDPPALLGLESLGAIASLFQRGVIGGCKLSVLRCKVGVFADQVFHRTGHFLAALERWPFLSRSK